MKHEELEKLARLIAIGTYNAYSHTLVGYGAPRIFELSDRLQDIQIGDLIVEITTCLMPLRPALDAVGVLLRITQEPVDFGDPDFVWNEEEEGRPHPTEKCTYIRTLDGREFRWTNASFVSVPAEHPMRTTKSNLSPSPPA